MIPGKELEERSSTKYETEVKFAHYKKIFDSALQLYEKEKNNTHFIKSFDTLMKPVVKAVEECKKTLNSSKQQST
ncbi:hypothetical protein RhiirB3_434305 [Rhizophagus irregularis]|nr:hypothetical protein RhiirB3_434305 [Rhizophagus irregularis]